MPLLGRQCRQEGEEKLISRQQGGEKVKLNGLLVQGMKPPTWQCGNVVQPGPTHLALAGLFITDQETFPELF